MNTENDGEKHVMSRFCSQVDLNMWKILSIIIFVSYLCNEEPFDCINIKMFS